MSAVLRGVTPLCNASARLLIGIAERGDVPFRALGNELECQHYSGIGQASAADASDGATVRR